MKASMQPTPDAPFSVKTLFLRRGPGDTDARGQDDAPALGPSQHAGQRRRGVLCLCPSESGIRGLGGKQAGPGGAVGCVPARAPPEAPSRRVTDAHRSRPPRHVLSNHIAALEFRARALRHGPTHKKGGTVYPLRVLEVLDGEPGWLASKWQPRDMRTGFVRKMPRPRSWRVRGEHWATRQPGAQDPLFGTDAVRAPPGKVVPALV